MTALTTTTAPKKPRSWKRRLIFLGIFVLLLPVILLGIGQAIIAAVLNPEWLVLKIEKSRNCRAEVSACSANLFGFPAYVEVRGLKMIPRDKAANQGNSLTARSKVQLTHTGIAADLARVEVNVWALLAGRLSLGDIRMQDVDIRGVVRDDQDTLKELLAPAPSTEPLPPPPETVVPEAPKEERKFRAKDLPMPLTLGSVTIERGRFSQSNRRKKRDMVIEDFTLHIGPAEINPRKLTQGNRLALTLSGRMASADNKVDPPNRPADLKIAVQADIQPFDPGTGNVGGRTEASITVQKDSALNKLPSLVKLAGRMTKLRDRAGLDLTKLPTSGTLVQDAPLHLLFENGVTTFRGDTSFTFDTWNLILRDGSRITGGDHTFTGVIQPTKADTDRALSDLDRFLRPKAPATADKAQSIVSARLVDKDTGRLSIPFTSTGDIGKPDVKVADAVEKVFYDLLIEVGTSGDEMDEILSLIQKKGKAKDEDEDKEPEKEKKKPAEKKPAAEPDPAPSPPAGDTPPAEPVPVPADPAPAPAPADTPPAAPADPK